MRLSGQDKVPGSQNWVRGWRHFPAEENLKGQLDVPQTHPVETSSRQRSTWSFERATRARDEDLRVLSVVAMKTPQERFSVKKCTELGPVLEKV